MTSDGELGCGILALRALDSGLLVQEEVPLVKADVETPVFIWMGS